LARNFVRATPTVIGSPTRSRTSQRSCLAMSVGDPRIRAIPRTSRNASSIDSASTSGAVSSKTSKTALLASEYAVIRGDTTIACGQSRRAVVPPMRCPHSAGLRLVARRQDDARADDDGLPRSRGSSRCSTEA
jgi:hypothetical protein